MSTPFAAHCDRSLLQNLMTCMAHYGDSDDNPLRHRIAAEFPALAAAYPETTTVVWVIVDEEMMRVRVMPCDFANGVLVPERLRDLIWRVKQVRRLSHKTF